MIFDFVNDQGRRHKHRDHATKQLIRRRATQAAALTKRKEGTIRGTNPLQLPPWVVDQRLGIQTTEAYFVDGSSAEEQASTQAASPNSQVPAPMHVGYMPSLLSNPAVCALLVDSFLSKFQHADHRIRIGKVLKLAESDFLGQLSAKYGENRTLDAAIDCLVARVKEFLCTESSPESHKSRQLYARALRLLQKSLSNDFDGGIENIWYTTPTLVLFELLDAGSHTAWILHACGAAKLLKQFGAHNIRSEAQKILFAAQAPVMIIEALATGNDCYLTEPEWQGVLLDTVADKAPLEARSEVVVKLFMLVAQIPNLFNEVTSMICSPTTSGLLDLQAHLLTLRAEFRAWNKRWSHVLDVPSSCIATERKRIFNRLSSYAFEAMVIRLYLALDTSHYLSFEAAAMALARKSYDMDDPRDVRLAYSRIVCESIFSTSCQWDEDAFSSNSEFIGKEVFLDWVQRLGRPVDDGYWHPPGTPNS